MPLFCVRGGEEPLQFIFTLIFSSINSIFSLSSLHKLHAASCPFLFAKRKMCKITTVAKHRKELVQNSISVNCPCMSYQIRIIADTTSWRPFRVSNKFGNIQVNYSLYALLTQDGNCGDYFHYTNYYSPDLFIRFWDKACKLKLLILIYSHILMLSTNICTVSQCSHTHFGIYKDQ